MYNSTNVAVFLLASLEIVSKGVERSKKQQLKMVDRQMWTKCIREDM